MPNARFIADGPALLKALIELADAVDPNGWLHNEFPALDGARAAIAKARGQDGK